MGTRTTSMQSGYGAQGGYGARVEPAPVRRDAPERDGLAWGDLLRLATTRPWIVFGSTFGFAILLLVWFGMSPPTYRASATLIVDDQEGGGLLGGFSLNGPPVAAGEIELLRSRTVAETTVNPPADGSLAIHRAGSLQLGLATSVEDHALRPLPAKLGKLFGDGPKGASVHAWIAPDAPHEAYDLRFEGTQLTVSTPGLLGGSDLGTFEVPLGEEHSIDELGLTLLAQGKPDGRTFEVVRVDYETAVKRLRKRTQVVETERNTGVLRVTVDDPDPVRAASIVNALCQNYLAANVSRGKRHATQTLTFLESQIEAKQEDLEKAQEELVAIRTKQPELINVQETTRQIIERASELAAEEMRIELTRTNLAEIRDGVREGSIAQVTRIDDPALFDPVFLAVIERHQKLEADSRELAELFTEEYPDLIEARRLLADSRTSIEELLTTKLVGLDERERQFAAEQDELEKELALLPAAERQLADPMRRSAAHQAIYQFLLRSQQEAQLTQASTIASTDVIDPAVTPTERHAPRLKAIALFGLILGLGFGLLTARIVDLRVGPIESAEEFEATTGLAVLSSIPDFRAGAMKVKGAGREFLALRDAPDHPIAEAYRSLRANVRRLPSGSAIVHVASTSAAPGEGKSTTNIDLALASAATGRKVLLVDADMRKPSVHRYLGLERSPGLAEVLEGAAEWKSAIHELDHGLKVLTAGRSKRSPGDLFASERAGELLGEFADEFDVVVYDLPPALAVADAADFAHRLDAMLLVHRMGAVPRAALAEAKRRLDNVGAPLVGGVLNGVKTSRGTMKRYGYGYYGEDE